VRRFLRDLLPERFRRRREPPPVPAVEPVRDAEGGIAFHALGQRLMSPTPAVREEAVLLVTALCPDDAARPLVRSYVLYGDRNLLPAVQAYGRRLTPIVAREARDLSLAPSHRARLMDILGATQDPVAERVLREATRELEHAPRISASAALVELGDRQSVERLEQELLSIDARRRTLALDAVRHLEAPEGARLAEGHALRYLAGGDAIPQAVSVALPLLIDPEADVTALLVRMAARSDHPLTLITGPATGVLTERRRGDFVSGLREHELLFSTARHALPERFELLAEACRLAGAVERDRPVTLIGPLPNPADAYPSPHLLEIGPRRYTAQVVYVGPFKLDPILDWWRYLDEVSMVPAELHVVLADLALGGGKLTDEELIIHDLVADRELGDREDAFARAYLARLAEVHS
jgi:hypothetical protein